MELSGSNIKKCLIFSQKKACFIFREVEIPKKILIFHVTQLSYISGSNFLSSKNKKTHSGKTSYTSGNGSF